MVFLQYAQEYGVEASKLISWLLNNMGKPIDLVQV